MSAPANRFSELPGMSETDAYMLNDAYQAITVSGNWDNMKYFNGQSFMFSQEPWISNVMTSMHYRDQHSGASFGITMRAMEYIAKHGWDSYAAEFKEAKPSKN